MSQEQAPNILSSEEHRALEAEIKDVSEVAREADYAHQGDRFHDEHNSWVDVGGGSTRMLGQMFNSHRVNHEYGRFGNTKNARTDVRIREGDREIHSYSDRRAESTSTRMKVERDGKTKELRSENPFVYKMLAGIALKDIKEKAQADIDQTVKKAA